MDVFDKLRKADGLSDADHAILDYVLDNPDRVAGLTSRGLAELTHTSSSSVVRFCRKLGFEGYNDFKINIADTLKRTNPGTTRVTAAESALSASAKTAELLLTAVAETRRTMDLGALERASDLLAAAREIDVCGNGPNEAIAQHATHMLVRTGHLASLRSDTDYLVFFSALVPADHAAIVISGRDAHGPARARRAQRARDRQPHISWGGDRYLRADGLLRRVRRDGRDGLCRIRNLSARCPCNHAALARDRTKQGHLG